MEKEGLLRRVIGVPLDLYYEEDIQQRFDELSKALSWLRDPGILKPEKFAIELDVVYTWGFPPSNQSLEEYLQQQKPSLQKLIQWTKELCTMVQECHDGSQPLYLGRLSLANLRLQGERLQLLGITLTRSLRLTFENLDPTFAGPPEELYDARSDCWCLGTLLQTMIQKSGQTTRQACAAHPELSALLQQACAVEPARRPLKPAAFKARLEALREPKKVAPRWSEAPRSGWRLWLERKSRPLYATCFLLFSMLAAAWGWVHSPPPPVKKAPSVKVRPSPPRSLPRPKARVIWGPTSSRPPANGAEPGLAD